MYSYFTGLHQKYEYMERLYVKSAICLRQTYSRMLAGRHETDIHQRDLTDRQHTDIQHNWKQTD